MTPPAPPLTPVPYHPWLHAYALLLVVCMFGLVAVGGTVTSRGVGLAVPDGWWTFGYFTLWAPPEVWWHEMGTRWEHSHRLKGYLVGMLTIGLAIWLWRSQRGRRWLQWAGVGLLALVSLQGVMGAARVDQISTNLAIVHGVTGQIILGLTVLIATATSRPWLHAIERRAERQAHPTPALSEAKGGMTPNLRGLRRLALALIVLLLIQLALGALIRHTGSALAIPDFPAAYGQLVPPLSQPELDRAAAAFPNARPSAVSEVAIHFSHRVGAVVVLTAAVWLAVWLNLRAPGRGETKWPARWLMALMAVQIALGASVIWSGRYPELATAHQAVGAALLAVATWLAIRVHLLDYAGVGGQTTGEQDSDAAPSPSPSPTNEPKEQPA